MSDEQHPEIVDIGLPATIAPTYATLVEISSGQLVNIHDPLARGMANRLLALEVENARLKAWQMDIENREAAVCPEDVGFDEYIRSLNKEIAELRGEVGFAATME